MLGSVNPHEVREPMDRSVVEAICAEARTGYDKNLFGYHNVEHHIEPIKAIALGYLANLQTLGVEGLPDPEEMEIGVESHDDGLPAFYGYADPGPIDPSKSKFPEHYAMARMEHRMLAHHQDQRRIEVIKGIIRPTQAGVPIDSWGGMDMVVSDLSTAMQEYDTFMAESPLLRPEFELMKRESVTEPAYHDFTVWLMSKYVIQNLKGAKPFSVDIDPLRFFATEIRNLEANTKQLAQNRAEENHESLESYIDRFARNPKYQQANDIPTLFGLDKAA